MNDHELALALWEHAALLYLRGDKQGCYAALWLENDVLAGDSEAVERAKRYLNAL